MKRFRAAAFLILLKWLLVPGFLALFVYALLLSRRDLGNLAIGLFGLTGIVSISHLIMGAAVRCPLCLVSPFSHLQLSKSTRAKHFFGSYRLFVALGVFFKGCFHCPYCGKNVATKVRRNSRE